MASKERTKALEYKIWELHKEGLSQAKIAEKVGASPATVNKYAKRIKQEGYEPPQDVDQKELEEIEYQAVAQTMTREEKMEKAFNDAIDMLYVASQKAKKGIKVEDDRGIEIPLKTLMDCIERAGKHAETMSKAAKEARKGITPETIDYKEMAKLYVSFNPDTGKFEYNSKGHMQEVLNKAYKKES